MTRGVDLAPVAIVLLVGCAGLPLLAPPWTVNHDVAWFLHAAARWLAGDRLYVDIVDPNLPLATYLAAVPTALARATDTSPILAFHAFVLLLVTTSVLLVDRVAFAMLRVPGRARAVLLASLVYALVNAPGADFGQREHLLAVLLLPWIAVSGARHGGWPVSLPVALAAGGLAGIGIGLKPHFLAALLVLALPVARRGPRCLLHAENAAWSAVLLVYLAHFATWSPEVLSGFAHTLGLARQTYGGFETPLGSVLAQPAALECGLLGAALLLVPADRATRALAAALGAAWLVLLATALWQLKGWSYHFLAAASCGRLLLAVVAVAWLAHRPRISSAVGGGILVLIAIAVVERGPEGLALTRTAPAWIEHAESLRELAGSGPVLALDTSVAPHFPAFNYAEIEPTSRFACLWPLPALAAGLGSQDAERFVRGAIAADLRSRPPRVVVVKRPPLFMMVPEFDILDWLRRDPRFAEAWRDYVLVRSTDQLDFYRRRD